MSLLAAGEWAERPLFYFNMDSSVVERVWRLAEPLVSEHGMEIVDIEYRREGQGNVLRFYLDRAEGGISVDELTTMSRRLGHLVELDEFVPDRYTLEVSSPGINRRLRRPEHFQRFVGKRVRVRTVGPIEGRRAFVGALVAVEDEGIRVAAGTGERFFAFADIAQANYEHDFPETQQGRPRTR